MKSIFAPDLLKNLPDGFNPVFVKELRQTLHGKVFFVTTLLLAAAELLVGFGLSSDIRSSGQLDPGLMRTVSEAANIFVCYLWTIAAALMLSTILARWHMERGQDALAPEYSTPLSAFTVLRGKIYLALTLLAWTALVGLPFLLWTFPKVLPSVRASIPIVFVLNVLCLLAIFLWSAAGSLCFKPKRDRKPGFGSTMMLIGAFPLCSFLSSLLEPERIHDSPVFAAEHAPAELNTMIQLWAPGEMFFVFYAVFAVMVYAVLILYGLMLPRHSNRFFHARLWGIFLLGGGIGGCCLFHGDPFRTENILALAFAATAVYLIFHAGLTASEPWETPVRMTLDAPADPVLRAVWHFCGAGMRRAWIYLLTLFAAASAVLYFWPQPARFDPSWCSAGTALVFAAYALIYGACASMIRRMFPKANGFILLAILALVAFLAAFLFIALAPAGTGRTCLPASISPLGYWFRKAPVDSDFFLSVSDWNAARHWFMPPVFVAFLCVLPLLSVRKKV